MLLVHLFVLYVLVFVIFLFLVVSGVGCGFRAASLSTYDFSTLYNTFPHNLIKEKLSDLIERAFQRE